MTTQAKVAVQVMFPAAEYEALSSLAQTTGRSRPEAIRVAVAAEASRAAKRAAKKDSAA